MYSIIGQKIPDNEYSWIKSMPRVIQKFIRSPLRRRYLRDHCDEEDDVESKTLVDKEELEAVVTAEAETILSLHVLTAFLGMCVVVLSVLLLFNRVGDTCSPPKQRYWSPVDDKLDPTDYENMRFNGSLYHESIYRQPGSPAVDAAWGELGVHYRTTLVSPKDAPKAGIAPWHVSYPEELGGPGYPVTLEVFHQLHCLNVLRQSSAWDYTYYYENKLGVFGASNHLARAHYGHCLEILRQQIMCNADTGLVPYMWVKDIGSFPDFSQEHKCRNFDAIREWGQENQVPLWEKGTQLSVPPEALIFDEVP